MLKAKLPVGVCGWPWQKESVPPHRLRGAYVRSFMGESLTLYKLMILYMLKKVNFALANGQLSDFFLSKGYTDYFTLQLALNELLDTGLICVETVRNTSRYEMTQEGEDALFYFQDRISDEIRRDMDDFLQENHFKLRSENSVFAKYYKDTATNEYEVDCIVKEGRGTLIELKLGAASEEMAEKMCDAWNNASKDIYAYVMKKLL